MGYLLQIFHLSINAILYVLVIHGEQLQSGYLLKRHMETVERI